MTVTAEIRHPVTKEPMGTRPLRENIREIRANILHIIRTFVSSGDGTACKSRLLLFVSWCFSLLR